MAQGDQPLSFKDLFDPTDKTALKQFQKGIKDVGDDYEKEISRITKENETLKKSQDEIIKSAQKLRKELKKNNDVNEDRRKTIEQVNEEAESLLKTQKEQEEQLMDNNKQITSLEGNLKELGTTTKKLNKLEKEALKVRKDEEKLQIVLNRKNEEALKTKLKLQRATAEQKRELKALLVLKDKESGTEERLLAQNELLRIERKKLNTETDKGAARLKEINDELDVNNDKIKENSDSLKAQKMNVGNYEESVKNALAETDLFNGSLGELGEIGGTIIGVLQTVIVQLKAQEKAQDATNESLKDGARAFKGLDRAAKATVILAIVSALLALGKAFSASRKAQREFTIVSAQIGNTLKIFGDKLMNLGSGAMKIYEANLLKLTAITKSFELVSLRVQNLNPFGEDKTEDIKKVNNELVEVIDNIDELSSQGFKELREAFDGTVSSVTQTNEQLRIALELEDRLIDLEAIRGRELVLITGELEKQQAIADDSTRSFDEQEAAARKVLNIQKERSDLELKTAKERLDISTILIKNDLQQAGLAGQFTDEQIRSLEFLNEIIAADAIQLTNLEKLKEGSTELARIESERVVLALEGSQKLGEINRDRFEQELDFALDVFDRQKSVNERNIADQTKTFEERFKLLEKTKRLNESSFESQIKLTEDFIQSSIAERLKLAKEQKILSKEEIDRLEAQLKKSKSLDIARLTTLEDEKQVRKELIDLAVAAEIPQNRIREIIIERKAAIQDLAEAERDLLAEFTEFSKTLDRDLKRIQEAFKGEALQLDVQQLQELISLRKELEELDKLPETERVTRRKEILTQLTQLETNAASERNEIILSELELKKATIAQELSEVEGSTLKELQLKEDLQAQLVDIESEITKNKIEQEKAKTDIVIKEGEKQSAAINKRNADIKKGLENLAKEGIVFVNTLFDVQKQRNQDDLTELQILKEHEIALAGDNAQRKIEIEQEFFAQEQEIRNKQRETIRKQAIFNKAVAVTEIGINTAQAIIAALAPPPIGAGPVAGIPLAAIIGGIGALQLATAIASPIPRFEKGTKNAPEGMAMTDERGPEIHADKRGRIKDFGSTKGPRLKFLEKGDIIKTAQETSDIMQFVNERKNNSFSISAIDGAMRGTIDAAPITMVSNGGITVEQHRKVMRETLGNIVLQQSIIDEKGFRIFQKRKGARVKKQQRIIHG
jgi:hypothetical protein